jgi:hypothetical protein
MYDLSNLEAAISPFRPHEHAVLLGQIKEAFVSSNTDALLLHSIEPLLELDTAQKIMAHGSMIIPWCWTIWNDNRVVDYDIIQFMV